jgi:predicted phage-related endonuclease
MNFTVIDAPQRSEAWREARCGRVTGSKAGIVYMGAKTAGREDYLIELALGRATGAMELEGYVTKEMIRGIELEGPAKAEIEMRDGVLIRNTGFLRHNTLMIGISLDGDIDNFGVVVEVKCPKSKTHIRYLEQRVLPSDYRAQVMHGLYITGAQDALFASYDDRMPPGLELFTKEVRAQDLPLEEYEKALLKFLSEISDMEAKLRLMQRGQL